MRLNPCVHGGAGFGLLVAHIRCEGSKRATVRPGVFVLGQQVRGNERVKLVRRLTSVSEGMCHRLGDQVTFELKCP